MTWAPPKPNVWGYTLAQLEAVRREAIEECAKVCEDEAKIWDTQRLKFVSAAAKDCASLIRKLLEQK